MKRQPRILAGTALGLLMASAPLGASPLQGSAAFGPLQHTTAPMILAQDDLRRWTADEEELPRKKTQRAAGRTERRAGTAGTRCRAGSTSRRGTTAAQEEAGSTAADRAGSRRTGRTCRRTVQQAAPQRGTADQAAQEEAGPQQQIEAAPAEQPAEQAAPATEEQPPSRARRSATSNSRSRLLLPNSRPSRPRPAERRWQPVKPRKKKRKQDQQIEAAPAEQAPATKDAPAGEPVPQAEPLRDRAAGSSRRGRTAQDKKKHGKKPVGEQPVTGEQQPATGEQQPATGEQPATAEQPAQGEKPAQGEALANPDEAPILDSQKDARRKPRKGQGGQDGMARMRRRECRRPDGRPARAGRHPGAEPEAGSGRPGTAAHRRQIGAAGDQA